MTDEEDGHFLNNHVMICGYRHDTKEFKILEIGPLQTASTGTLLARLNESGIKVANDDKYARYQEELKTINKVNGGAENRDRSG